MDTTNEVEHSDASRHGQRASAEAAIRRMTLGDDSGLAELYDRYAPLVTGLALRIVGDPADAQDVLQVVFLQAWRQADRYDTSRGAPEAWLCTITRTRALDQLRRRIGRKERPEATSLPHMATPATVERLAVQRALSELSPTQRHALELAYYEGLSQSEIATRLGEPLGTIKTRIRRGMAVLRSALKPLPPRSRPQSISNMQAQ
jgi:RNA polymerase sigma-70 factor (ECF subfamily)